MTLILIYILQHTVSYSCKNILSVITYIDASSLHNCKHLLSLLTEFKLGTLDSLCINKLLIVCQIFYTDSICRQNKYSWSFKGTHKNLLLSKSYRIKVLFLQRVVESVIWVWLVWSELFQRHELKISYAFIPQQKIILVKADLSAWYRQISELWSGKSRFILMISCLLFDSFFTVYTINTSLPWLTCNFRWIYMQIWTQLINYGYFSASYWL